MGGGEAHGAEGSFAGLVQAAHAFIDRRLTLDKATDGIRIDPERREDDGAAQELQLRERAREEGRGASKSRIASAGRKVQCNHVRHRQGSMTSALKGSVPPRLIVLGWELLKSGALAFGGLGSTLALLQRRLGAERGWVDQAVISEGLAFTRALPGSTGIQIVAYLCHRLCGWPGTLVGTIAFIAPATLLMVLAAAFALALPDHPAVDRAFTGLQVGVVGLLAASMWRLARSEVKNRARLAVLLVCAVLGFFVNAVLVVVLAGTVGILLAKDEKDV